MKKKEIPNVEDMLNDLRAVAQLSETTEKMMAESVWNTAISNSSTKGKYTYEVPLILVHIDESYQRTETFSKAKGDAIALDFSEFVYEPIKLNYRNGKFYCPSGQHRIYAHIKMRRNTIYSELVCCTRNEEIAIFLFQDDNRSKLSQYDRFKAGCELGLIEDVALRDSCEAMGITIGKPGGRAQLNAVVASKAIIRRGGEETFRFVLSLIIDCGWEKQKRAFDTRMMRALNVVFNTEITGKEERKEAKERIVNYIKREKYTPDHVFGIASVYQKDIETGLKSFFIDVIQCKRIKKVINFM